MKIAMIFDPYLPVPPKLYGGTERSSSYLIEVLQRMGHEIVVFAAGNSTINCEVVPCSPTDVDIKRGFSSDYIHQVEEQNVHNLLDREKSFDIIHWHAKPHAAMEKFNTPILCTPHVTFADYFNTKQQILVKKFENQIYFSSISKSFTRINPSNYIDTIYHGLPINRFPFEQHAKGYISFVGRYSHHKQPHIAAQAAIALGKKIKIAARLDVFGQEYFDTHCKELLKHPLVQNIGEVTDKEKINIFQSAEVNLHPIAFDEPFGLTVVEAGLCGTPTIAFDRGSMRELIQDGISGYVVKTLNELLTVYPKASLLDRQKVRKHFEQFNNTKMGNEYEKLYKKIIYLEEMKKIKN